MTTYVCDYLEFVPPILLTDKDEKHKVDFKMLYVYSRKKNGKRLKKAWNIGAIYENKKTNNVCFVTADNTSLSAKTMVMIAAFMRKLEVQQIKYDFEKGEFVNE